MWTFILGLWCNEYLDVYTDLKPTLAWTEIACIVNPPYVDIYISTFIFRKCFQINWIAPRIWCEFDPEHQLLRMNEWTHWIQYKFHFWPVAWKLKKSSRSHKSLTSEYFLPYFLKRKEQKKNSVHNIHIGIYVNLEHNHFNPK